MDLEVTKSEASGLLAVTQFSGLIDDQSGIDSYPSLWRVLAMKAFGDVDKEMLKPVRSSIRNKMLELTVLRTMNVLMFLYICHILGIYGRFSR